MTGPRAYDQFCGLAVALDIAGDRWMLLVVRDLVGGARRFSDLKAGLVGIPTATLSRSLSRLIERGLVVQRKARGSVGVTVYALTDDGQELARSLVPLAAWGARRLGRRPGPKKLRSSWLPFALHVAFDAAHAVDCTIVFETKDALICATVHQGELRIGDADPSMKPDVWLQIPLNELLDFALGRAALMELMKGARRVEGAPELLQACIKMFGRLRQPKENRDGTVT